jgi:hypothetical protein
LTINVVRSGEEDPPGGIIREGETVVPMRDMELIMMMRSGEIDQGGTGMGVGMRVTMGRGHRIGSILGNSERRRGDG